MNIYIFFYKDGQGHDIDSMNLVDEELYVINTISTCSQLLSNKLPERPSIPVIPPTENERNGEDMKMEL